MWLEFSVYTSFWGCFYDLFWYFKYCVCVYAHHQMEAVAEEQAGETQKERKLRERNEQYSRQLEEELEGLKVSLQRHTHRADH